MKVCPKCKAVAADENQAFCLMDGTPLVDAGASEPTLVMNRSEATVTVPSHPRKKRTGLWIALLLGGFFVIGGLGGLLMFAAYKMGAESAAVKVNANGSASSTPKPSGTNKPTPQPTASAGASPEDTPSTVDQPSSDAPTPISWTTNASFVKLENGLTYSFECPAGGTPGTVWGSGPYTADSSVCTAAVHAGKITLDKGGVVTILVGPGKQMYGATTQNGITTFNYGQYPHSISFK